MGFFKKLKKRIFTLNYDHEKIKLHEQKEKVIKENKSTIEIDISDFGFEKTSFNSPFSNAIKSKTLSLHGVVTEEERNKQKQKLKDAKKRQKIKAKELKINKYLVGLEKSRNSFSDKIRGLQNRYQKIDEDFFEELEEILIMSDVGVHMTMDIVDEIKKEVKKEKILDPKLIGEIVADKMFTIYTKSQHVSTALNIKPDRLNVILVTGVNGSGKTTTIAKAVNIFKAKNYKTLIAAADTFRAGAVAQLEVWAEKLNAEIVKPKKHKQDPASVVYEAIKKAKTENYDILIVDTAGRLQNKVNLMNELAKIKKIIVREIPEAPHETILVIDATTGQNGIRQAVSFNEITNLTGIVLTKMDGTSKGGIILGIKEKINVPVKYIGFGEGADDMQEFDLDRFIYGLTKGLINEDSF